MVGLLKPWFGLVLVGAHNSLCILVGKNTLESLEQLGLSY